MRAHFVHLGSSVVLVASALIAACSSNTGGTNTSSGSTSPSPDGGTTKKPTLIGSSGGSSASKDGGAKTPTPPPSTKTKTCKTAALCLGDCPDDDFDCQSACLDGMSDAENAKLQKVSLCIGNSGCNDDDCVQEVCAAEIAACIGD